MTGLALIDEGNEQLLHTRAIEIIEKINSLERNSSREEKRAIQWIDTLEVPRHKLKGELMKFWADKRTKNWGLNTESANCTSKSTIMCPTHYR